MNKRVLFIILIGNVFFLNSCSKSTSWPPEEQLFRDRLYRVVWDKADPRPWAEYFKQHPSWVEKHKKVMLLSPDVSAEEYLAMIYVSWEDWPNAQYFLEKGLAKKRSHYGLKMLINLAAQTQNAALLTSLSARERASFGVYYDIRQAIANRKYEQALVSLNLLLKVPPADRAPEKFAQSDNLLWYLKVLALTGKGVMLFII